MGDEIDMSIVQRTQQKLGKYIQRPQLTEKLLRRPPFRFLHDIVAAACKQYGILEGVFSKEELASENIKDKESKIAFLQKLIKCISTELKEELNVKPTKIVAGSEPARTNELLQAIASLLEKKQKTKKSNTADKNSANNTKTAAKQTKSEAKTEKAAKTEKNGAKSAKSETKTEDSDLKSANSTLSNQEVKSKSKSEVKTQKMTKTEPEKSANPETETEKSKAKTEKLTKSETETEKNETKSANSETKTQKPETETEESQAKTEKIPKLDIESIKTETRTEKSAKSESRTGKSAKSETRTEKSAKSTANSLKTKETGKTMKVGSSTSPSKAKSSTSATEIMKLASTTADDGEIASRSASKRKSSPKKKKEIAGDSSISPGDSELLELNDDKPADVDLAQEMPIKSAGLHKGEHSTDEGSGTLESNSVEEKRPEPSKLAPPERAVKDGFEKPITKASASPNRPVTGNGLLPTRPNSSRRPPSRTVRNNLTVIHQDSRPFEGHVPRVIVEGNALSDDEEDKIVEGAVFDQIASDFSLNDEISAEEAGQGKLVEQIRSAQKRLDPSADADLESKEAVTNKIQSLKSVIQEMAQSAMPLGHIIPVIHEDMETMFLEWQFWKKEAESLQEQINREESVADPYLDRLQAELEALDKVIEDLRIKLNVAKASVLRSENDVSLVISNFGGNH